MSRRKDKTEEAPPHHEPERLLSPSLSSIPNGGEGAAVSNGGPPQGVDAAALQSGRRVLEGRAKDAGKAARELAEAAEQLQLAAINAQPEFESVMLEPPETIRKRYTAQHAQEIEIRRNACLYMLGRNCPVEDIAHILKMNLRTISALAGLNAEALAGFGLDYAEWLNRNSAKAFQHAIAKLPEANALQAATVGGIMADKAIQIRSGVPQGGEEQTIVELEDPALRSAREFVERLKQAQPAPNEPAKTFNIQPATPNSEGTEKHE